MGPIGSEHKQEGTSYLASVGIEVIESPAHKWTILATIPYWPG